MKLDIIIVDLVLIAAVALPYILFILLGRKEVTGLKNKFSEEVQKNELNLHVKDKWNNNIVGVDKGKFKLLVVQKRRAGYITHNIDLKQVNSCSVHQETQVVRVNKQPANVLQKIDLNLVMVNGSLHTINLFDCSESYSQEYELAHAEKWNRMINESIVYRSTVNSAA